MKNSLKEIPGYAKALIGFSLAGNLLFLTALNYGMKHPLYNSPQPVTDVKGASTNTPSIPVPASKAISPVKSTKDVQETETIPYTSSSVNDSSYDSGKTYIKVQGSAGQKVKTYKVMYENGAEVSRSLTSEVVSVPATNEVVAMGTKVYVTPAPASQSVVPTSTSSSAYYANCTAARAAGVTPIYSGEPGYRSALDRDNDGIACE